MTLEIVRSWRFLLRQHYLLLACVVLLSAFGLLVLFSVSEFSSERLYGSRYAIWLRQIRFYVLALGVFAFVYAVPLVFWYRLRFWLFLFGIVLLCFTLLFAPSINGSRRWIFLFGFSIQTTLVAYVAFFIFWSALITRFVSKMLPGDVHFYLGFGVLALLVFLVFLQPDWSMGIIGAASGMGVLFLNRFPFRYLFLVCMVAFAFLLVLLYTQKDYHLDRVLAVFDDQSQMGASYQASQSDLAIRLGGFWGVGFGEGTQKLGYLPEAHNDFIFSSIAEELGSLGTAVLSFVLLSFWGYLIWSLRPLRSHDLFGRNLVSGLLISLLGMNAVHMMVNLGLLPVTGISLPFFSYGGTLLIYLATTLGMSFRLKYEHYLLMRALEKESDVFSEAPQV